MDKKHIIDTEENKAFLKNNVNALLAFGHRFPSPGGSSYYLGDDGTPWKERNLDHQPDGACIQHRPDAWT